MNSSRIDVSAISPLSWSIRLIEPQKNVKRVAAVLRRRESDDSGSHLLDFFGLRSSPSASALLLPCLSEQRPSWQLTLRAPSSSQRLSRGSAHSKSSEWTSPEVKSWKTRSCSAHDPPDWQAREKRRSRPGDEARHGRSLGLPRRRRQDWKPRHRLVSQPLPFFPWRVLSQPPPAPSLRGRRIHQPTLRSFHSFGLTVVY